MWQLFSFSTHHFFKFVSYNNEIQRKLIALNNKGTWTTRFFRPCMQKNYIYASDYPVSEHMKFICAVNIYASGTVWIWSWSIAQYPPPCNPPCFPNSLQVIIYIPLINTYIDWEVTVVKFVRDPLYPSTRKSD